MTDKIADTIREIRGDVDDDTLIERLVEVQEYLRHGSEGDERFTALVCDRDIATRERDEARQENERLAWNLAGCLTIAESRKPSDFNSDMATPAIEAVNAMATEHDRLQSQNASLRDRLYQRSEIWCDFVNDETRERAQRQADETGSRVDVNVFGTTQFVAQPKRLTEVESENAAMRAEVERLSSAIRSLSSLEGGTVDEAADHVSAELETLRAFVGGEILRSDYKTAGAMRAEICRLRTEVEMLRMFGIEDCTKQADSALRAARAAGGEHGT